MSNVPPETPAEEVSLPQMLNRMENLGNALSGVVLVQRELVLMLEEQGVLTPGEFQERLEDYLKRVSPERRDASMYDPMRALIKALSAKKKVQRRRAGSGAARDH